MKKIHFVLTSIFAYSFILIACGGLGDDMILEEFIGNAKEVENLFEKHQIAMTPIQIWNDGNNKNSRKNSNCTIRFISIVRPPSMKVFATIVTERITYAGLFEEVRRDSGYMQGFYFKYFRSVNGFRLNNEEEYTIEVIVKISEEYQRILSEKQNVHTIP